MPYVHLAIFLLGLSSSVSTFAKSKNDLLVGACRTDFPVLIVDTFPDADTPVGGEIGDPDQQYESNRKKVIDINGDGINEKNVRLFKSHRRQTKKKRRSIKAASGKWK